MADQNMNNHVLGEDKELALDLDISAEIRFSRKDHPEGKMIPVSVDGKEEFVLIPLNVKDGDTVKVKGRGKYNSSSGKTGDLYVLVHIDDGKKNPWIMILISVLMVTAISIALFLFRKPASPPQPTTEPALATSCDHVWIPADCTTPKTCKICGETSGAPLGHQWQEATYDAPKTCSVCGTTEGEPLKRPSVFANLSIGDTVRFGEFEQDNNLSNGKEPVEWIILDIDDDRAFLISRYGLDCRTYHDTNADVTWETCSLREWLNNSFLNSAFSEDEAKLILTTSVSADANPDYKIRTGNDTEDRTYVLSLHEAKSYYPDYRDRVCTPTDYAVAQGAFLNRATDGGWWWLRTPGDGKKTAASINSNGSDDSDGSAVNAQKGMVRPVMWVTTS